MQNTLDKTNAEETLKSVTLLDIVQALEVVKDTNKRAAMLIGMAAILRRHNPEIGDEVYSAFLRYFTDDGGMSMSIMIATIAGASGIPMDKLPKL